MNHVCRRATFPALVALFFALVVPAAGSRPATAAARSPEFRAAPAQAPDCASASAVTSAGDSGAGTLRQAVADSCDGGTITFAADMRIPLQSHLELTKTLTIDGAGHTVTLSGTLAASTTIDGGIFWVNASGPVTLRHLMLTNATGRSGGAIYNWTHLTLDDSSITNSQSSGLAQSGGAIYNNGTLTVTNSLFESTTSARGGALYNNNTDDRITVSGSTFHATTASSVAGAIYNNSGVVRVSDSDFTSVTSGSSGGSLFMGNGTLAISGSTFSANTAGGQGGVLYMNNGTLAISGSTFSANSANSNGGAISMTGGTATISGSTFSANTSTNSNGGAIYMGGGTATISGSTFSANTAGGHGGALGTGGGATALTLGNTTFSANTAADGGGAINLNSGTLTLSNSTLSANAATNGGGLRIGAAVLQLKNTIIADSPSGGDCVIEGGSFTTNIANLIEDGTCSPARSGDPLLSDLGGYGGDTQTFALLPGSPAIGGGHDTTCAASPVGGVDQRGVTRPALGCDIGAFESQRFMLTITGGDNQITSTGMAFAAPLAVSVAPVVATEPVSGGVIMFRGPTSGASITPTAVLATIDAAGTARASVTANAIVGTYPVTATNNGTNLVTFNLHQDASVALSVSVAGSGRGTVASAPAGISCGAGAAAGGCSAPFSNGTVVTLTATASPTATFTGWSGACAGTGACVVSMDEARAVTATFALQTRALSVSVVGNGAVMSNPAGLSCGTTCAASFDYGTTVTLTATASPTATFTGWSGACAGTGPCVVSMDEARAVTATFEAITYQLYVPLIVR